MLFDLGIYEERLDWDFGEKEGIVLRRWLNGVNHQRFDVLVVVQSFYIWYILKLYPFRIFRGCGLHLCLSLLGGCQGKERVIGEGASPKEWLSICISSETYFVKLCSCIGYFDNS